jgi:hypothetical protein
VLPACVVVALVFGIAPAAQAAVNVVPNPGFEQAGCGASTPIICGWTSYNEMVDAGGTMALGCGPLGCDGGLAGIASVGAQTDPAFCAAIGPGPHPASFVGATSGDSVYFSANFYQGTDCTGYVGSDFLSADMSNPDGPVEESGVFAAPAGTQSALFSVDAISNNCSDSCFLDGFFSNLDVEDTVLPDPALTSFTPDIGPVGANVDIHGWGFSGATNVEFNGTEATFTVDSNSEIHAIVPAGATTGPISVNAPNGIVTSSSSFTNSGPPPTITSFTPTSGPIGTTVDIFGSNFTWATSLSFGCCSSLGVGIFTIDSDSEIHATVPNGATIGPISVTTPSGTGTSSSSFTPTGIVRPAINSFAPTSGTVGSSVDIVGSNFNLATAVTFASISASFTVNSDSEIHATVPDGATTGPITVTTPHGTGSSSTSFTVTPVTPAITAFTPTSGPAGTTVDIQGSGFTRPSTVRFNGTDANYTVNSDSEIHATVPAGATTGPISITVPSGVATSPSPFTVIPPPAISTFTPTNGPAGTTVDLQGGGFTGVTDVTFNGTSASYTANSDSEIHATVPAGATTGLVAVTAPGGTVTSSSSFTVIPPPAISTFTPTSGPAGTTVDLQGGGFTGVTGVTFNGTNASYTVNSDSEIHATVPAGATTGPISVSTPGGSTTSAASFTVIPPPTISAFAPTSGHAGQHVTISGLNFTGVTAVKLGTTSARFILNSSTKITAVVPTIAHGYYHWSVTTVSGTATTSGSFHVP